MSTHVCYVTQLPLKYLTYMIVRVRFIIVCSYLNLIIPTIHKRVSMFDVADAWYKKNAKKVIQRLLKKIFILASHRNRYDT